MWIYTSSGPRATDGSKTIKIIGRQGNGRRKMSKRKLVWKCSKWLHKRITLLNTMSHTLKHISFYLFHFSIHEIFILWLSSYPSNFLAPNSECKKCLLICLWHSQRGDRLLKTLKTRCKENKGTCLELKGKCGETTEKEGTYKDMKGNDKNIKGKWK